MDELVEFWQIVSRLKEEPRRGWKQTLELRRVESVADHSFGVAILSMLEGQRRGYNLAMMLKLALMHDLEEAIIGDLTPSDKKRVADVNGLKTDAINRVLAVLPRKRRAGFRKLWVDLRQGKTREAVLVKDLDLLEMALQARKYERRGISRRKVAGFYGSAVLGINDKRLRNIVRGFSGL